MAEDYTQRATCECYYKFENGGDLGEDNQNQIDLTNANVTQNADIPSGTYASPGAGKSAEFNGSTAYMTASHADSSEIDDITGLTVVFWLKTDTLGQSAYWVDKTDAYTDGWIIWNNYSSPDNRVRLNFSGSAGIGTPASWVTGKWYFLVATYDGDHIWLYWGDEETQVTVLNDQNAPNDMTASTTSAFWLGQQWDGTDKFDGRMCEVAVFSEALGLSDLEDIQQYGMEGGVPPPSYIPQIIMIT